VSAVSLGVFQSTHCKICNSTRTVTEVTLVADRQPTAASIL